MLTGFILAYLPVIEADTRIKLDQELGIEVFFYNYTDNRTYMDINVTSDVEDSLDKVRVTFDKIEVKNNSFYDEDRDRELELNSDKIDDTSVADTLGGVCEGKTCFVAYSECLVNFTSARGKYETCESQLPALFSKSNRTDQAEIDKIQAVADKQVAQDKVGGLETRITTLETDNTSLRQWRTGLLAGIAVIIVGGGWYYRKNSPFIRTEEQKKYGGVKPPETFSDEDIEKIKGLFGRK